MKTSIIIPVRNEVYLVDTIDDIFKKATGEIEVIIILDGCWNTPLPEDRPNLSIIHFSTQRGMRAALNAGVSVARGKYLIKCDAHCLFMEGFDEVLTKDCDSDWIVTPRRFSLEPEGWTIRNHKPHVDYEYYCYPFDENGNNIGLHAKYWWYERDRSRKEIMLDENMSFQGSLWCMSREYFMRRMHPMEEHNYGTFYSEGAELGLKCWLSGGRVMLNKNCWYSHLWKGQPYRDLYKARYGIQYFRVSSKEFRKAGDFAVDFWLRNKWSERIHDFDWLIDRFSPVPTWPEDRSLWTGPRVKMSDSEVRQMWADEGRAAPEVEPRL